MFGLALSAVPAMLSLALGRARSALSGPAAGALAATGVALVLIGGIALGLAWLRKDARQDAVAVCQAERLALELEAAKLEAAAIAEALGQAQSEVALRRVRQNQIEATLAERAAEAERLRHDVQKAEEAAGAARAQCLPDDGWLRRKRRAAAGEGG